MQTGFGKEVAHGAVWVYGRMLVAQTVNFVAIAILARQLEISAFGLVALANVLLGFIETLGKQGVNQFIIYDREEGFEERAKAAFWLNLTLSLVTVAVGVAVVHPVSRFFGEPQLVAIVIVLLIRFPLEAITRIPDAVLQKRLHFKSIEVRETLIQVGISTCAVFMALAGFGVWSLVIPHVALAPVQAWVAYSVSGWRPGWSPRFREWRRIMSFTTSVIGNTVTSFVITEGDSVLIGRLMGPTALGLYNLAWRTSNLVSRNLVSVGNKLCYPLLSAVAVDRTRMAETLRRLLKIIASLAFPLLIGLFVVADEFILVVYGAKWEAAVIPLRILLIYALRYAVGSPLGSAFNALGRPDLVFKIQLGTLPVYCAAIWTGSAEGIIGVAVGVTLVRTTSGMLYFWMVARLLSVRVLYLLQPMGSSLLAAAFMGIAVFGADWLLVAILPGPMAVRLILLIVFGTLVYLSLVRFWFQDIANEYGYILEMLLGRRALPFLRLLNTAPIKVIAGVH